MQIRQCHEYTKKIGDEHNLQTVIPFLTLVEDNADYYNLSYFIQTP